jgi:hypothetical protein
MEVPAFVAALAAETTVFLGEDLLAWLVLALGGAMAVGSIMALVRPPETPRDGELARAPVGRSIVMAVIGGLAALWAVASLLANGPPADRRLARSRSQPLLARSSLTRLTDAIRSSAKRSAASAVVIPSASARAKVASSVS